MAVAFIVLAGGHKRRRDKLAIWGKPIHDLLRL